MRSLARFEKRFYGTVLGAALLLACTPVGAALEWPQEIDAAEGTIVVYQPQPERLAGNVLSGRAAVQLEFRDRSEPVFGVMWFTARLDTDRDTDTAFVRDTTTRSREATLLYLGDRKDGLQRVPPARIAGTRAQPARRGRPAAARTTRTRNTETGAGPGGGQAGAHEHAAERHLMDNGRKIMPTHDLARIHSSQG